MSAVTLLGCDTADGFTKSAIDRPEPEAPEVDTNLSVPNSYGALASRLVPRQVDLIISGIDDVNLVVEVDSVRALSEYTLPHEVSRLREQVQKARDFVDIFAFAYPHSGDTDAWKVIRDKLEEGDEVLGSFEDAYAVRGGMSPTDALLQANPCEAMTGQCVAESSGACGGGSSATEISCGGGEEVAADAVCCFGYDEAHLDALRQPVLDWATGFVSQQDSMHEFLSSPSEAVVHARSGADMSPYFWLGVSTSPNLDRTAVENLSSLEHGLAERAIADLGKITQLDEILDDEYTEATLADYLGRLVAVQKVSVYFPEVFRGIDVTADQAAVDSAVESLEALLDRIRRYNRLSGTDAATRDYRGLVMDDWDAFVHDSVDLTEALSELARVARHR